MKILITNDDGSRAPGLIALRAALLPLGEVVAIAPDRPRSACGHAITLHKPLRLMPVDFPDGGRGFAINGFPADCVALGVSDHLGGRPDIVVSGINVGPNLGVDMIYSGTVAAAREAAICGLPSFAISIASYEADDFQAAAQFAKYLCREVGERGLPTGTFLNVNVPAASASEIAGVAFTRQSRIRYDNRIETRTDPRGEVYYWLTGDRLDRSHQPDADVVAIEGNRISITPVRLNVTNEDLLADLPTWNLRWPR
ncbi:MAG: 5'/3'-nucleotidase SurE [Armatimonadota bacterium]|nr:MAG: 5'/3'-nucleotidase SurE [Armatimonadota bacterium]